MICRGKTSYSIAPPAAPTVRVSRPKWEGHLHCVRPNHDPGPISGSSASAPQLSRLSLHDVLFADNMCLRKIYSVVATRQTKKAIMSGGDMAATLPQLRHLQSLSPMRQPLIAKAQSGSSVTHPPAPGPTISIQPRPLHRPCCYGRLRPKSRTVQLPRASASAAAPFWRTTPKHPISTTFVAHSSSSFLDTSFYRSLFLEPASLASARFPDFIASVPWILSYEELISWRCPATAAHQLIRRPTASPALKTNRIGPHQTSKLARAVFDETFSGFEATTRPYLKDTGDCPLRTSLTRQPSTWRTGIPCFR